MTGKDGPLVGLRVLELAAAGPVPFCGMVLADLGADVVRVERPGSPPGPLAVAGHLDVMQRGKRVVQLDLKAPAGRGALLELATHADALLEGFRPGVMNRLGLSPETFRAAQPRMIYCRVSGRGDHGPAASRGLHDLNALAESGALHAMGPPNGVPAPPLNLVADFGGAGMLAVIGVLAALHERARTGLGEFVSVSMVDACRLLMASICAWQAAGTWSPSRGANLLDGSCPWYAVYRTLDGAMLAVASVEPPFYAALMQSLQLGEFMDAQFQRAKWPELACRMRACFAGQPAAHWMAVFEEVDACVSPVHPLPNACTAEEAEAAGWAFQDGVMQPKPQPSFDLRPAHLGGLRRSEITWEALRGQWAS